MRLFKSRSSVLRFTLVVFAALACNPDLPTDAVTHESVVTAKQTGSAYTTALVPLLAGDNSSHAKGVNDAGEVVGYSCCSQQNRPFVTLSGVATPLPGNSGLALAISNGSTRYIVGSSGSLPVRWSFSGNTPSQPAYLDLGAATWGSAIGVNDAGDAVGNAGVNAAMWDQAGNVTIVATPSGYTRGEGRDINNTGEAVFVFSRSDVVWNGTAIGYVRLAAGQLIPLPPLTAGGITYANTIGPSINGQVKVAGSSYEDQSNPRAVLWTIDIALQQIVGITTRPEDSHLLAVADAGVTAGFLEGPTNSLRSDAFRWEGTTLLKLSAPKGWKMGQAWAISPNGRFIAGEVMSQARRAVLWTFP